MGSAMSSETSVQKAESQCGTDGDHMQKNLKECTSLPVLEDFNAEDINSTDLSASTVLFLGQHFPQLQHKLYIKFLLQKGVQPFEDASFQSAGILTYLVENWPEGFKASPEMELLRILTKFAALTKAPTRIASLAHFEKSCSEETTEAVLEDKQLENVDSEEDKKSEQSNKVQKAWGKGVGYGSSYTGDTADWDVADWKRSSMSQQEEIVKVLNAIMRAMSEDFAHEFISESCVIPALLSYCQNDSFHDITSKPTLYTAVFSCIGSMLLNAEYLPLLFECHGSTMAERICKVGRQAEQVVKMGESVDDTTEDDSTRLANLIAQTYKRLTKSIDTMITTLKVSQALTGDTTDLHSLLTKLQDLRNSLDAQGEEPVVDLMKREDATSEHYEAIMRELCFGSVEELSDFGPHKYKFTNVMVKRKLMKRLAGEFADLPSSLPIHHESSVFFRFCEEKMSHAQMLIIPADGTPYAAGCFVFDVMFPSDYPNSPPKVNLATTGHGSVRFNPNLYECGKVCLSLLGTWQAYSQAEKWRPEISTFLQVAISIQSLIFVPEPYYNEPGDEDSMGTDWGNQMSEEYNEIIRLGTTKYAMIEMLEKPPAAWKDVIETHFSLQGDRALRNVTEWLGKEDSCTKKLASLLENLRSKIDSSSEEIASKRNLGA